MIRISRGSRPPMPALYHFNTRLLGVWPYCGMWLPSQCRACILVCLHPRIGCRLSYAIYIQRLSVANALVRSWQSDKGSSVEEQRNQIRTKALLATRREEMHHD
jgi:hypothetical protein